MQFRFGIRGDELCKLVKENPDTSGIPVVLLTAKANHEAIVEGLKKGADDYIPKPGASVTHVDASKGMVTWAKENAVSSGLKDAPIRWIVDDCVKFVEREIRRGNHYDAIIMDPPSYGRGPKGEIWKIEEAIHPLIKLCAKLLSDDPLFFLVNSYTTGLAPAVLTYMIATELKPFNGHVDSQEIGLPVSSNGLKAHPAGRAHHSGGAGAGRRGRLRIGHRRHAFLSK